MSEFLERLKEKAFIMRGEKETSSEIETWTEEKVIRFEDVEALLKDYIVIKKGYWKLGHVAHILRSGVELSKIDSNLLGKALFQIEQEIFAINRGIRTDYYKLFLQAVKNKKNEE